MKLIKACKELNIGMSTAIDFCAKIGRPIALDPNAKVSDDLYLLLAQQFGNSNKKMNYGIRSISFRNFRKFANLDSIQLNGITYLVGGNNAGKSTVVKALRLVMENLKNLQSLDGTSSLAMSTPIFLFDIGDAGVGTFSKALLRTASEQKIVFDFDISETQKVQITLSPITEQSPIAHIDLLRLTDKTVQHIFEVDVLNAKMRLYDFTTTSIEELDRKLEKYRDEQIRVDNVIKEIQERLNRKDVQSAAVHIDIVTRLNDVQTRALNLKIMVDKLEKMRQSLALKNEGEKLAEFNLLGNHDNPADNLLIRLMRGMQGQISIQNRRTINQENYMPVLAKDLDQMILNYSVALASDILEYIGAHAATQKTIFSVDDNKNVMVNILREWKKLRIIQGESEYQFVLDWIREWKEDKKKGLGIGYDFDIEDHYGEAYSIKIQEKKGDTKWASLSELGMGAIQMVTLLLRLACIMRKYKGIMYKPLIMIEEPEQNMHPSWQSHLADIFEEMRSQGFRLLVETHSEYLIRKSQLQVAAMKFVDQADLDENCPISTWYFPNSLDENGKMEVPYDMHYRVSGKFMNSFKPGFFDVSSKFALDLLDYSED